MRTWSFVKSWLVVGVAVVGLCSATPVQAADELPKAEELIDKSIEAMGGRANMEKIKTRVSSANMEMAQQNISGVLVVYDAAPNKNYSMAELKGLGKTETGSNGDVRWELSSATGPRLVMGEEAAMSDRMGRLNWLLDYKKLYKSATTRALESVGDQLAYRIELMPESGKPFIIFIDSKSFLMTKTSFILPSAVGDIPMDIELLDYREVDGIKAPFKQIIRGAGVEQVITFNSIKHNVEIPEDRFDLPEPIKALAERAKQKESEGGAAKPKKP